MRYPGIYVKCVILLAACIPFLCAIDASGDEIMVPDFLWQRGIANKSDPLELADTHLRIAYRDDGTLDEKGYFTTFSRPDIRFDTPGLNCSGLVLSVSRFLFGKNFSLMEATRDRQGNSGEGSALGKDWDFGLDLILNISDGVPRKVIMPDGSDLPLERADGTTLRGFDLHDRDAWRAVLSQMQPGRVYLGSISKSTRKRGYRLLHYHVVIMIPDDKGGVWLYHSTHRSRAHKMNLNTGRGLNRLMAQFRNSGTDDKKILVVEALLREPEHRGTAARDQAAAGDEAKPSAPAGNQDRLASEALKVLDGTPDKPGDSPATSPMPSSEGQAARESAGVGSAPPAPKQISDLEISHISGKVFNSFPELVTHIPRFVDESAREMQLWFRNRGNTPKNIDILLRGPDGDTQFKGTIPPNNSDLPVVYPRDFGITHEGELSKGRYGLDVRVGDKQWFVDVFEVAVRRDAVPRIIGVSVPSQVRSGTTFTVHVRVVNDGAESDYGGITLSTPDPSGLKLVSAQPGRVYSSGSTVLSVTSDKIRTKVPMAERWIELWGENQVYDMKVRIRAGRPGTYPIYVRCTLRSVNVKSSVVLMDPQTSDTRDQQGFPVQVFPITVQ